MDRLVSTVLKYHVEVYTGDRLGAGTNSNVFICVEGERGDTGRRHLKHSRTYGLDKFEQDHVSGWRRVQTFKEVS